MKFIKTTKCRALILCIMLTLLMSVGGFFASDYEKVSADTTYTITFKYNDTTIKEMTVEAGGYILERDLPRPEDGGFVVPNNEYYRWFYSLNNGQTFIRIAPTGDGSSHAIENINCDVVLWVKFFPSTSNYHKVTFILPDSTKVIKTVENGGTVDEPIYDLGFCEKLKFDKELTNIKEDMTINVSIDNTYKYIFVGGCLAMLVGSLVVIVVIIFKSLSIEDDDDDEEEDEEVQPSITNV